MTRAEKQLEFRFIGAFAAWHADGFAGTHLDFLDWVNWVPGEVPFYAVEMK